MGAEGTPVDVLSWMHLGVDPDDASKQRFAFTPRKSSDAGQYEVTVVGTDAGGEKASAVFALTVSEFNDPPKASSLADQTVLEDVTLTDSTHPTSIYVFPVFTDEEDDAARVPLKYSYTVARLGVGVKTEVSPKWIEFDKDTRTFKFTPSKSLDAGSYEVTVVGADAGIPGKPAPKSVSAKFALTIGEFNDAPVASSLVGRTVLEDVDSTDPTSIYVFDAFTDEETYTLTYSYTVVRLEDDDRETAVSVSEIEQRITFDDKTRTFTFTPSESRHKGVYRVRVFAQDTSGAKTSVQFRLTVGEFNDVPVASSLVGRTVLEDVDSTDPTSIYVFDAFTDEEEDKASRSLLYTSFWAARDSAGGDIVDGDGEKTFVPLPKWIVFDGSARRFTFTPHRSWDAGRYTLRVVGTDKGIPDEPAAKSAIAEFVLEVLDFNDAPVASTLQEQQVDEDTTAKLPFQGVYGRGGGQGLSQSCVHGFVGGEGFGWE